jgi:CHASE3 domain sensor protein
MASSESSCRGFALTGEESYLESYRTSLLRLEQDQDTIRNLTVDNPDQQRRLPLLATLVARQIGQMDLAINLRRADDSAAAADAIQSRPVGDEFQEAVRNLQGEELRLRLLRDQDARRRLGQTKTVLVFGTALGVLIAVAAGWSVQRDSFSRGLAEEALRLSEEKYRVLLGRDLSESKESGAKYRGLLEAAPDAMVVVNSDGEILLLNVQAEKQFGYSRDELVGQKVKNIIPEGFAERLIADGTAARRKPWHNRSAPALSCTDGAKTAATFPSRLC